MDSRMERFRAERERLNELVCSTDDLNVKRFFALDAAVYREGALPARVKELLGLAASLVLRCDDCIAYHVDRCFAEGVTRPEFDEAAAVALVVGGSVVIPHLRRARDLWEELSREEGRGRGEGGSGTS